MAWTSDPFQHDSTCIVGDTWTVQFTLEDSADVAHDLTGVTGVSSVRDEPGDTAIATPTVTVTDADSGEFEVTLAASTTAQLSPGTYLWAARLTWPDSTVKTVVEGLLTVRRAVVA